MISATLSTLMLVKKDLNLAAQTHTEIIDTRHQEQPENRERLRPGENEIVAVESRW